ncbi:MAG: hypothetical protein KDB23_33845, partial [Planctomycetales bacterium]|nr:hypothetical protein [Planctomycetales bacterium]
MLLEAGIDFDRVWYSLAFNRRPAGDLSAVKHLVEAICSSSCALILRFSISARSFSVRHQDDVLRFLIK